jgi:hypothetical protein
VDRGINPFDCSKTMGMSQSRTIPTTLSLHSLPFRTIVRKAAKCAKHNLTSFIQATLSHYKSMSRRVSKRPRRWLVAPQSDTHRTIKSSSPPSFGISTKQDFEVSRKSANICFGYDGPYAYGNRSRFDGRGILTCE